MAKGKRRKAKGKRRNAKDEKGVGWGGGFFFFWQAQSRINLRVEL